LPGVGKEWRPRAARFGHYRLRSAAPYKHARQSVGKTPDDALVKSRRGIRGARSDRSTTRGRGGSGLAIPRTVRLHADKVVERAVFGNRPARVVAPCVHAQCRERLVRGQVSIAVTRVIPLFPEWLPVAGQVRRAHPGHYDHRRAAATERPVATAIRSSLLHHAPAEACYSHGLRQNVKFRQSKRKRHAGPAQLLWV
jgi:hypothetical protein